MSFPPRLRWCFLLTLSLRLHAGEAAPAADMEWLDNGVVRIGMDLSRGGAVTHLSSSERPGNLINSFDLGRQIQMSHYSGPTPFVVGDKQPRREWAGLGWNPIQTGDCFGHPSRVREHHNDGKELHIVCVPMQWPLDNVPGECEFETWTTLDGPCVNMRFRLTNHRADHTQYGVRPQELPAIYTIAKLHRLTSYTGDQPFTGGPPSPIANDWRKPWPWTQWIATEGWAALVGDDDWGLGVFKDRSGIFHGGLYGEAGSDDPHAGPTAYMAPVRFEILDHDIVYEHRCVFMVGKLADLRAHFNMLASREPPAWRFATDRQHWYANEAHDGGLPFSGAWLVQLGDRAARLVGPCECWRAEVAPSLSARIAYHGKPTSARIRWRRQDDQAWDDAKSLPLPLITDGRAHDYRLDLSSSPHYRGLIVGLALDPADGARPGESVELVSLAVGGAPSR